MKRECLFITLVLGLGLTMALLWLLSDLGTEPPVARAGDLHVCPSGCTYSSIQAAVDAASDGDVIKVATGTYTGVSARAGVTQVVYISKSVTIQGGYTTAFTEPPNPEANPTTLDAQEQGRVLYITGNISPTVEGLRITGGHVGASGGGIYSKDANLALVNTIITNNISSGTNWPDGLGGGVSIWGGSVTLNGGQIISNSASYKGGGVSIWGGSVTLNGGQIMHNTAKGPTGWDGGGGMFVLGSATLNGVQVISNAATINGGGLYVYLSDVMLSGVQIIGNSATWAGGGAFIWWAGSAMSLNGGEISNNSAHIGGGVDSGGALTLTNSVVSDNQADGLGCGLCLSGDSSRLLHTTIVRNFGGDGSGVHVTGSAAVAMTNTILVSHTVGITVAAGNTATLTATLWGTGTWANLADWGGAGTIITGTINIWDQLDFVDPDRGDYHIGPGSAAIDAGVPAGVIVDIDGESRLAGTAPDIGADEYYHPALDVAKQADPDPVRAGAPLTYTIFVTNTGNVTLSATITDILPTQVVPTDILTWTTVITAPGGIWSQAVPATVAMWYAGPLTNVVRVTTKEGVSGVYTCTTEAIVQHCYLPLMLRDF
jgi:uncharacterized repeat protein (TIGR01451 family)